MRQFKKEDTLYFSIFGKNRKTGMMTLNIRKEADIMASLQKDTLSQRIQRLRNAIKVFQPNAKTLGQKIMQLPEICPGVHFCRNGDEISLKHYNGIITIIIKNLLNRENMLRIKAILQTLPQTRAVFCGYDNRSLILLFRFLNADDTLPTEPGTIRQFHKTAYKFAIQYIRPYLPYDIEIADTTPPEISFHQTLDISLFYKPQSEPIYLNQLLPIENPMAPRGKVTKPNNALLLHDFMLRNYELRYNILKDIPEYRPLNQKMRTFCPVDQIVQNSMVLDAQEEGLDIWDRDIKRYLYSNRLFPYKPAEEYLKNTRQWDGVSYIKKIADCVKCDHPHWELLFRRWFLCMVANWQGRNPIYANCTSPLLIGKQGYRKSTFCRLLLPPELRSSFTDRLDIENKRAAEIYLSRFLLINLDEFDQINNRQQAFLKHLLQKNSPCVRKPYTTAISETRRYTSFIGTSNTQQLLYDASGNRRFLCIEVKKKIEFPTDIDYSLLYAEALYALDNGERYWFDEKEETKMQTYNQVFEVDNKYAQLFWSNYRRPRHSLEGTHLSCTQILRSLCTSSEFSKLNNGHIAAFGRQLQKWGLEKRHEEAGNCYKVVKIATSNS